MEFDSKANADELKQLQYDPLRDPALLEYLSKPRMLRRLIRLGLISRKGRVKTSYKMLSDYRTKYLHGLSVMLAQKKVNFLFCLHGRSTCLAPQHLHARHLLTTKKPLAVAFVWGWLVFQMRLGSVPGETSYYLSLYPSRCLVIWFTNVSEEITGWPSNSDIYLICMFLEHFICQHNRHLVLNLEFGKCKETHLMSKHPLHPETQTL